MTHPIDLVYVDLIGVAKSDVRTYIRDHTLLRLDSEAAAALINLAGQKGLAIDSTIWKLDPADTTSAASPGAVIVSLDGLRYKPAP